MMPDHPNNQVGQLVGYEGRILKLIQYK